MSTGCFGTARIGRLARSKTFRRAPKHSDLIAKFEGRYGWLPHRLPTARLGKCAAFLTRLANSHSGQPREAWLEESDARLIPGRPHFGFVRR